MENIKFRASYNNINTGYNKWRRDSDQWSIEINGEFFDFWTGTGLRKNGSPVAPTLFEILESLFSDQSLIVEHRGKCDCKIKSFLQFHDELDFDDIHETWYIFSLILDNTEKLKKALGDSFDSVKKQVESSIENG